MKKIAIDVYYKETYAKVAGVIFQNYSDKIPEDNRNDIQKLESKGFDKKISFRKRKL